MVYLLSLYWDLERSGSRVNLKMYLNHLHRQLEWETTVCLRYFYEEKNLAQQYCKYNDDISCKNWNLTEMKFNVEYGENTLILNTVIMKVCYYVFVL